MSVFAEIHLHVIVWMLFWFRVLTEHGPYLCLWEKTEKMLLGVGAWQVDRQLSLLLWERKH